MQNEIHELEMLTLSGGKGTRLAAVWENKPKVLAPVGGAPYFDWFVDAMRSSGFRRFRFLLGYGSEQVVEHIGKHPDRDSIEYLIEDRPLGTGGAIKNAFLAIDDERVFVANGDSYCPIDYVGMLKKHLEVKADCSIALAYVENSSDYGSVSIGEDLRVEGFREKRDCENEGFVNAGVYILERKCTRYFPKDEFFSLEKDVFPKIAESGGLYGFRSHGSLLDIGTPERLLAAQSELARLIAGG
ncbi:MAG: NDP-sugar pyrophosphorylase family protein [Candidatus Pelagisphaera sp.]|jgi:NDP-sugar pyrophosphorylase family protein